MPLKNICPERIKVKRAPATSSQADQPNSKYNKSATQAPTTPKTLLIREKLLAMENPGSIPLKVAKDSVRKTVPTSDRINRTEPKIFETFEGSSLPLRRKTSMPEGGKL